MKAMIFAAGEGTRLRPLTLTKPKALVEVGGKPMLARVLEAVKAAGVKDVTVNVHYLADQIIDYLAVKNFDLKITISDERERLLDTGGGLLAARASLEGDEPILLHNADIATDLDLRRAGFPACDTLATLLIANRESSRKLLFEKATSFSSWWSLCGWRNEKTGETKGQPGTPFAFNGIHVVSPAIFPLLEEYAAQVGPVFSLTPFYVAMAATHDIRGQLLSGYRWHDIGNLQKLQAANEDFA